MSASDASSEVKHQFLSFDAGGTRFGVPILKVKEILQYEGVTRVPGTPRSIRGVINVRGAVVPVVDLSVKFGRGASGETRRSCVLVVEMAARDGALTLGVLSDAVDEVIDLAPAEIEPPPAFGAGIRLDYVTGMGKVAKGFVVLLDMDRVLSATESELVAAAAELAAAGPGSTKGAAPAA
jgi:purine-binding chemotaxis protein CheW